MTPNATPRIFLSHTTSDSRDHTLAHKLAAGLRDRLADVWIAPDSIPPGESWEEHLVTAVMQQCTHFVVILSAASIQAEWVLKEIALAEERRRKDSDFKVLPLKVGRLDDYSGRAFLDALQWVSYHDEPAAQLDALARAIGLRPHVRPTLPPTAVAAAEFVGREYVFDAIDGFVGSHRAGYFVIEGDPGSGKSALLAEYVRRSGCLAHFNVRALGINTAAIFLESLCSQLISRYQLPYPAVPLEAKSSGAFLATLLDEVSHQLGPQQRLIIAVDALDEVDLTSHPLGSNILFLPPKPPDQVYFVLTRRQQPVPLVTNVPTELYDLLAHRAETLIDIRTYVERAASRDGMRSWMSLRAVSTIAFIDALIAKSNGNFMYLRHVLSELERGGYDDLALDQLPSGLEAYYEDHWRRMGMTAKPLPVAKIRIIYVLSEVRRPVSRRLVAQFSTDDTLRVDELNVQDVLDEWDPFLHEQTISGTRCYSLYHATFADFLHRKDIVQAAGVSIASIHGLIADDLWSQLFGDD